MLCHVNGYHLVTWHNKDLTSPDDEPVRGSKAWTLKQFKSNLRDQKVILRNCHYSYNTLALGHRNKHCYHACYSLRTNKHCYHEIKVENCHMSCLHHVHAYFTTTSIQFLLPGVNIDSAPSKHGEMVYAVSLWQAGTEWDRGP